MWHHWATPLNTTRSSDSCYLLLFGCIYLILTWNQIIFCHLPLNFFWNIFLLIFLITNCIYRYVAHWCGGWVPLIFMSVWEEKIIFSGPNLFASHIRWCGRYIDDLLRIWGGTRIEAEKFVNYINSNTQQLKFTSMFEESPIHFLDLTITGNCDQVISMISYGKSTATNSMLMADSCHPNMS